MIDSKQQSDVRSYRYLSTRFTSRQSYGELLTLIALRDGNHAWAAERLDGELAISQDFEKFEEERGGA